MKRMGQRRMKGQSMQMWKAEVQNGKAIITKRVSEGDEVFIGISV